MSLFGDLDIESAEVDPNALPDNWYEARVTEVKVQEWKNAKIDNRDEKSLVIEYTVNDGSEFHDRTAQDFLPFPYNKDVNSWDKDDKERAGRIKKRLMDLDVPEDRVNSVEGEDILNLDVRIKVKNNGQWKNVNDVVVIKADGGLATFQ